MSKQDNLTDFLTDLAKTIRRVDGGTDAINPQSFSDRIRKLDFIPLIFAKAPLVDKQRLDFELDDPRNFEISTFSATIDYVNRNWGEIRWERLEPAENISISLHNPRTKIEIFRLHFNSDFRENSSAYCWINEGRLYITGGDTKEYGLYWYIVVIEDEVYIFKGGDE